MLRPARRLLVPLVAMIAMLAGCTGTATPHASPGNAAQSSTRPAPAAVVDFQPADGAGEVTPGDPVVVSATGTTLREVTLTDAAGAAVPGNLDASGNRWTANGPLKFSTRYTLTSTSVGADGTPATRSSGFTTATPKSKAYPSVIPLDGETTGVGIPIVIKFSKPVTDRAAAERRLKVTSEKPAEGAWRWFGDDEVHYRTKDYWPAYTKITLDIDIGGVALGNGVYGETSRHITFQTGPAIISQVSDKDKQLRTYKDGQLALTSPVSLGKPSALSVSGKLLVMSVQSPYTMDSGTYGVPADSAGGYRTTVQYALRLTNSGQFLHSAPWSVAQQGRTNVSHGCINVSTANAKWFYENSHRGDVVEVTDTPEQVKPGDGWTQWRYSWDEWTSSS